MQQRNVIVIPQTKHKKTIKSAGERHIKVAAYARVSTDKEEQQKSFADQQAYYQAEIPKRVGWTFAGIYADEESGLRADKRKGFLKMIDDALSGKFDYIIVKEISRFARNTLELLKYTRLLKEHNVGVYFEGQSIDTLTAQGEMMMTIIAALAQDESRSTSERVKWGQKRNMENGIVHMQTKNFIGYTKNADGEVIIDEKQAEIVRNIFKAFIYGKSANFIARDLTERSIPTPQGRKTWGASVIYSIIQNEKYYGDVIMQKSYTPDFLTKKMVKNNGELEKFHITNHHPAIISKEVFDMAQAEVARRTDEYNKRRISCNSPFSGRVVCGECGGYFGRKVWHSNTEYRRVIWRCNDKYKTRGKAKCKLKHIDEEILKSAFITAFNRVFSMRDDIIANLELVINEIFAETDYSAKLELVEGQMQGLIYRNAREKLDQSEYLKEYNKLAKKQERLLNKLETQERSKLDFEASRFKAMDFIEKLKSRSDILQDWNEDVWYETVDKIVVNPAYLTVKFQGGITEKVEF